MSTIDSALRINTQTQITQSQPNTPASTPERFQEADSFSFSAEAVAALEQNQPDPSDDPLVVTYPLPPTDP